MKKKLKQYLLLMLWLMLVCSQAMGKQQQTEPAKPGIAESALPLVKVLQALKVQHQINFVYEQGLLDGKSATVSVEQLKEKTPEEALQTVLQPLGLSFRKIDNQNYAIFRTDVRQSGMEEKLLPAQHQPGIRQQGQVSGVVQNEKQEPVAFATVVLLSAADSAHLATKLTDERGRFSFESMPDDRYFLQVSYLGYQKATTPVFELNSSQESVSLGVVQLQENARSLQEVVVVGSRPLIEKGVDRYTLNVENSALAFGNTLQLLKAAPFVDGGTKLQGKHTLILIDNRPVPDALLQEVLESLPGEEISKVEFITEPSSRYDASYGAVISIITKKSQLTGLTGTVRAEASQGRYGIYNPGGRLTYKRKNLTLFARGSYLRYNEWYWEGGDRILRNGETTDVLTDSTNRLYRSNIYTFQAGADWALTQNQTIGFVMNGNIRRIGGHFDTKTRFRLADGPVDSVLYTPGSLQNHGDIYTYSLNYQLTADSSKNELFALATYTPYRRSLKQQFDPKLYNPAGGVERVPNAYRTYNPSEVDIWVGQLDYAHTFKNNWKLETGLKMQGTYTRNAVTQEEQSGEKFVAVPAYSSNLQLEEHIAGAYGVVSKKWQRNLLQLGLRLENTDARAEGYFSRKHTNFFPNALAQHTFSEGYWLTASYQRQITRPPFQEVLPYTLFFDRYTVIQGNPLLRPSYDQRFRLNSNLKQLSVSLDYTLQNDLFINMPLRQDYETKVTYYALQNINQSHAYGIHVLHPVTINTWWEMNNSASGNYSNITGKALEQNNSVSAFSYSLKSYHTFRVSEVVQLEASGYYYSGYYQGLTHVQDWGNMDAAVMVQLWQKKGQLRIGGTSLLGRFLNYSYLDLGTFSKSTAYVSDFRRLRISLSYNFGNTKLTPNKQKSLGNEDAVERL